MLKIKKAYNPNRKIRKILLLVAAIVVLAGAGAFVWFADPFNLRDNSNDEEVAEGINYDPPGPENKKNVEEHKDSLPSKDEEEPQEEQPSGQREVKPFITIAQQFEDSQYGNRIEVRAYVSDIVESGGSCRVVLTKDGQKVTKTVEAQPDVSTTTCDTVMIPRSEIPEAGTWTAAVIYTSPNAKGTSDPAQVEVK